MVKPVGYFEHLPAEPELNYEQMWARLRGYVWQMARINATMVSAPVVLGFMDWLEKRPPFGAPSERSQGPILGTITGRKV